MTRNCPRRAWPSCASSAVALVSLLQLEGWAAATLAQEGKALAQGPTATKETRAGRCLEWQEGLSSLDVNVGGTKPSRESSGPGHHNCRHPLLAPRVGSSSLGPESDL